MPLYFAGPGRAPRSRRHQVWLLRCRTAALLRVGLAVLAGWESIVTAWLDLPPLHRCVRRFAEQVRSTWHAARWRTPPKPLAALDSPVMTGEVIYHPSTER